MNRETYFTAIGDRLYPDGLAYVQKAYWLVKEAHRRQTRRLTGERFFEHVRRVSYMAGVEFGYNDPQTYALGLLHDVIEDTFVPAGVISSLFGAQMYCDVLSVSKELPTFNETTGKLIKRAKIADDDFYFALNDAGVRPRRIKGCDRIDNLADLAKWEPARKAKYIVETEQRILPIIDRTDARMSATIRKLLVQAL